ncbi:hypothetical protein [Halohasta salina]|uniref:hypothetical protein n=1 Tax=Halohasta salina TaxID=2961621 RepID=UPI0020A5D3FD|nr:hypothetical protein [Halohasta salina]
MSVLSRYLAWFGDQQLPMQVVSTVLLFGLLFVSGVYTLGVVPVVVVAAVMVDHWYRAER